jgi:hypothetical protein
MMTLRWRRKQLFFELARTGAAFLLAALVSLMNPLLSGWQLLILPLCFLLGSHLFNCMVKLVSEVTIDASGIRISRGRLPSQSLQWKDMTAFEVRNFSLGMFTKKSLSDMKFKGPAGSIVIDDGLEQFTALMAIGWREARNARALISDTTRENLVAAGFPDARAN